MKFVKTDDLKSGMRVARPIYNRMGILLHERASKLTEMSISSIKNFGLIGIYVLEPAEPVPPMTPEDVEFERFQTMFVFNIRDELQYIIKKNKPSDKLPTLASNIVKSYGQQPMKVTFAQNLRSKEDYVYKHTLNVAILTALITHRMNIPHKEQILAIYAAILHDIGKLQIPMNVTSELNFDPSDYSVTADYEKAGYRLIDSVFDADMPVHKVAGQAQKVLETFASPKMLRKEPLMNASKALIVAEYFDTMTAMRYGSKSDSDITVVRTMMNNSDYFPPEAVEALISSINLLVPGISVDLDNGKKALVLNENHSDFLHPMVLTFGDNKILDLSDRKLGIEIQDITKTLDNRYVFNTDALHKAGFKTEEELILDSGHVPGDDIQVEDFSTSELEELITEGMLLDIGDESLPL